MLFYFIPLLLLLDGMHILRKWSNAGNIYFIICMVSFGFHDKKLHLSINVMCTYCREKISFLLSECHFENIPKFWNSYQLKKVVKNSTQYSSHHLKLTEVGPACIYSLPLYSAMFADCR